MIVFVPPTHHRSGQRGPSSPPPSALVVVIITACAGAFALAATLGRRGALSIGPGAGIAIAALVIGLGVGAAVIALVRARSEDHHDSESAPSADSVSPEERRPIVFLVLASVAGVVAALIAFLFLFVRTANSQGERHSGVPARPAVAQQARQFAHLLMRGTDTIIVERVTESRDSIVGEISARGAPRITYVAAVLPGPSVPLLAFRVYGSGAPADALPLQAGSLHIRSDSAIIEVAPAGGATQRVAVAITGSPLPLINGSMAMANLMLARARASSGRPYRDKFHFLQSAGIPLDVTVDSLRGDSVVFSLNGQVHRFALDADGRISGGVIPSQGITIARVSGAAAAKVSLGRPDYGAPAGAPYTAEEVTVPTPRGHSLSGTLTVPRGAPGRVPAVVTITGSGQQDRDEFLPIVSNYRPFRQLADTLGRRGIAVLRLDDRGINSSGGDVTSATSADFADDIRAGVAFLRARSDMDPARIALFGHSEGGAIGPMVAATDPRLAGVVLFAGPAYNGRKIIDFQLRNLVMGDSAIAAAKKDSAAKAQIAAFDSTAGKSPWMKFFLDYDPLVTLRKVRAPVLILQGGTDQQVTPEQAPIIEQTLKSAGNRDVTMRVLPARNHLFLADSVGFPRNYTKLKDGRIGPDVMGPLADWLVLKLSANRPQP